VGDINLNANGFVADEFEHRPAGKFPHCPPKNRT